MDKGYLILASIVTLTVFTALGIWKGRRKDWAFYLNRTELYCSFLFVAVFLITGFSLFAGLKSPNWKLVFVVNWYGVFIYHLIFAAIGNYKKWYAIPVIYTARTVLSFFAPIFLLLNLLRGRGTIHDRHGDPIPDPVGEVVHYAAWGALTYGFLRLCHSLVRDDV